VENEMVKFVVTIGDEEFGFECDRVVLVAMNHIEDQQLHVEAWNFPGGSAYLIAAIECLADQLEAAQAPEIQILGRAVNKSLAVGKKMVLEEFKNRDS